jgi:hypothetical protein
MPVGRIWTEGVGGWLSAKHRPSHKVNPGSRALSLPQNRDLNFSSDTTLDDGLDIQQL